MTTQITVADLIDTIDHKFTHQPGCRVPLLRVKQGSRGDNLLRCRSCQSWRAVEPWMLRNHDAPADAEPEEALEPLRPGVPTTSTWRCRTHPEEPVTWRGTGCRQCHNEDHR